MKLELRMGRGASLASLLLLLLALIQGLALLWLIQRPAPQRTYLPLLDPESGEDQRLALEAPGGTLRAATARLQRVGVVLTIEDVARGLLHLSSDAARQPLSEEQRQVLLPLVLRARELRQELLANEALLVSAHGELRDEGRAVLDQLDPQARRIISTERDSLSVEGVEGAYWQELETRLSAEISP